MAAILASIESMLMYASKVFIRFFLCFFRLAKWFALPKNKIPRDPLDPNNAYYRQLCIHVSMYPCIHLDLKFSIHEDSGLKILCVF